jgi:glycosyltransferase involved in cell wall biosynthesis
LGSVVRKKGVLELAPVFNKLHQQFPDVELWIIGKDCADHTTGSPSTWHLVEQAFDGSARKKVSWKGAMPHENALIELAQASIAWFPSYAEALPMTWIEAMMLGRPMLVSNGGWAIELVQHEHSALLVDPADHEAQFLALSRLLTDDSFRKDIGNKAHQIWQQQFSPEAMVKNVLSKYIIN